MPPKASYAVLFNYYPGIVRWRHILKAAASYTVRPTGNIVKNYVLRKDEEGDTDGEFS
jgi:hypothetical protein